MEVRAITKNVRMSARKGRPLARKCQGLPVSEALKIIEFSPRKAAFILGKTLKSAVANAQHNHELDVEKLKITLCVFDEGPSMKRFRPRARGSAGPIIKRLCHCKIVLKESL